MVKYWEKECAFECQVKVSSQNQQMKSKLNSKYKAQSCQQQNKPQTHNKISLLVNSKGYKNLLTTIPLHFSADLTYLDLSNNTLSSLQGIERYSKLERLNVSNNCIAEYQSLTSLVFCPNISEIEIQNNPISTRLNFMFMLTSMLQKVVKINGLQLDCSLQVLTKWQQENGYKIGIFLLQSCMVFDSLLKNRPGFDILSLQKQLNHLETLFAEEQPNVNDFMKTSNYKIYDNLPLKYVDFPANIEAELIDIKDYYIQKLLEVNLKQNNGLVEKILEDIEVADEEEQKQLSNRVQFTKLVFKNKIESQFYENQSKAQSLSSQERKMDPMRHFRSAQTALQTIDTAGRSNKDAFKYGIHFSLDCEYMQMAMTVMSREISRLVKVVDDYIQQNQLQTPIMESTYHINSYEDENGGQSMTSPMKVYNNFAILSNLLDILQMPVKRIAFRKIKNHRSQELIQRMSNLFANSLSIPILCLRKQSFQILKELNKRESEILTKMKSYRTKKILLAWRNIRKRKLKLLRNIVKRKIKCDKFQLAITLTRWKMNSRAERIRKMASAAILGTRVMSVPKSKKGIELSYQRIVEKRRK